MEKARGFIMGAGITGLAASYASGATALEADSQAGGICRSYLAPSAVGDYRFEVGGGHWLFGGDAVLDRFLAGFCPWKSYTRRSGVYFSESSLIVPYPLQYHLAAFGPTLAERCLAEIRLDRHESPHTMAEWLEWQFGPTLTELFFGPFHELYTAGLWTGIAPQDSYKTPLNLDLVARGVRGEPVMEPGYNQTFLYPVGGLNGFVESLAGSASVELQSQVVRVDTQRKRLVLGDGRELAYEWLLSSTPLDEMLRLAGITVEAAADPASAVMVANLGGKRGPKCPDVHWLYVPRSRSGFHRLGFYSNVDQSFLPAGAKDRVSIYVERGFLRGGRPGESATAEYVRQVAEELREWGFLDSVDVSGSSWVETAYTWTRPGSHWRQEAISKLQASGIYMTGRYGKWQFQGIADSLRDGLLAGAMLRAVGQPG